METPKSTRTDQSFPYTTLFRTLIDSHSHLNYKGLVEDQAAVIVRARTAGVGVMLNISTHENEWDAVLATAERNADICATVGIHPHEADAHPEVDTAQPVGRASCRERVGQYV